MLPAAAASCRIDSAARENECIVTVARVQGASDCRSIAASSRSTLPSSSPE
jgi:hypothetical protein